ncbi:hypothetical protein N0V90_010911 [Kalmusia sp. IMI 367209]|nr:hypothetical protein N0V90_010911 [Kalmusia sp. IMI 367209]
MRARAGSPYEPRQESSEANRQSHAGKQGRQSSHDKIEIESDNPEEERGRSPHDRKERDRDQSDTRRLPSGYDHEEVRRGRYRRSSSDRQHDRYSACSRSPKSKPSSTPTREARESPSHGREGSLRPRRSLSVRFIDRNEWRPSGRSPSVRAIEREEYDSNRRSSDGRRRSRSPQLSDFRDTNRRRNRSLTPIGIRENRIRGTKVPSTAYPLRNYTNYIQDNYARNRVNTRENHKLPRFRNGDGKVNPSAYGSMLEHDFGLCYSTFRTTYSCEMGVRCAWRHHPLNGEEKEWIVSIAGGKGRDFVAAAERVWSSPNVPIPGKNMIEVMELEAGTRRRDDRYR